MLKRLALLSLSGVVVVTLVCTILLATPAVAMMNHLNAPASPTDSGYFVDSGVRLSDATSDVVAGDLNGDGHMDLAIETASGGQVYLGNGTFNFSDTGQVLGIYGNTIAMGDWDGDSDLDLISGRNPKATETYVWLNDGVGTFISTTMPIPMSAVGEIVPGDVDADGDLDLLLVAGYDTSTRIWLNDGNATFTDSGQPLPLGADAMLVDVDGDNDLDVLLVYTNSVVMWRNNGAGVFTDSGQVLTTELGVGMDATDFDRDGDPDIAVANDEGNVRLWENNGNGIFQSVPAPFSSDDENIDVTFGDVDMDGDMDLFISRMDADRVWFNQGGIQGGELGTFEDSAQALGDIYDETQHAILLDVDGDNDPDAITAEARNSLIIWRNEGVSVLQTYYLVRDNVMTQTPEGQHYTDLYYLYQAQILQLLLNNPSLFAGGYDALVKWQPNMQTLVAGRGSSVIITQPQIDAMDDFLLALSAVADSDLQQVIAAERAALPPLDSFVGQSMSQAQSTVLGITPDEPIRTYLPLVRGRTGTYATTTTTRTAPTEIGGECPVVCMFAPGQCN